MRQYGHGGCFETSVRLAGKGCPSRCNIVFRFALRCGLLDATPCAAAHVCARASYKLCQPAPARTAKLCSQRDCYVSKIRLDTPRAVVCGLIAV